MAQLNLTQRRRLAAVLSEARTEPLAYLPPEPPSLRDVALGVGATLALYLLIVLVGS